MANDFSTGKVSRHILSQAVPLALAQLVLLLYNVVDRIYIGHLSGTDSLALTGVGLAFPLVTLIAAFTSLFGSGGAAVFAIARGARQEERAAKLMGTSAALLAGASVILMAVCYLFREPILYLFGASDASYVYADAYLKIYLLGTLFSMMATGLNGFINAQGFPRIGMLTTMIGAILNLILDPVFIFALHMGVAGAALATVISQFVSAVWVFRFLTGPRTLYKLSRKYFRVVPSMAKEICAVGASGFIMQATNCLDQVECNAQLQIWGGDLYVGIMTVTNSIREVLSLAVLGIASGAQPVMGYNYGARKYHRVRESIRFTAIIGTAYTIIAWLAVIAFPRQLVGIFTSDAAMLEAAPAVLKIYFFGFVFMSLQFAGQSVFQGLGFARRAITFSLLRKVVIVVPLTLLLPGLGFGLRGVYMAEPISNVIGGTACFVTMILTVYRPLGRMGDGAEPM